MHLHTYRDESRSGRLNLTGGGGHPWSVDLVSATASLILVVGFSYAFVALWVTKRSMNFFPARALGSITG